MTVHPIYIPSNLTPEMASLRVDNLYNELQRLQLEQNNSPATQLRVEEIQLELVQLEHYLANYNSMVNDLAARQNRARPVDSHQMENIRREHLRREFDNLQRGEIDVNSQARMFEIQREVNGLQGRTDTRQRGGGRNASGTSSSFMTIEEAGMRMMQIHQELAQLAELEESNAPTIQGRVIELQLELQRLLQLYPQHDLMFDSQAPVEDRPIDTQPPIDTQQPVENVERPVIPDWAVHARASVGHLLQNHVNRGREAPTAPRDTQLHTTRSNMQNALMPTHMTIEEAGMRMLRIQQELRQLGQEETPATQDRIFELEVERQHVLGIYPNLTVSDEVATESIATDTQQPADVQQPNVEQNERPVTPDWMVHARTRVEYLRQNHATYLRPVVTQQPVVAQPLANVNINASQNISTQPTAMIERIRERKRQIMQELVELDQEREIIQEQILSRESALRYLEERYPETRQVPIDTQQPMEVDTEQEQPMEVDTQPMEAETHQAMEVDTQQPMENVEQSSTPVMPEWAVQMRARVEHLRQSHSNRYLFGVQRPIDNRQVEAQPSVDTQQPSVDTQLPIDTQEPTVENLRQPHQDLSRDQELYMDRPEASRATDTLERTNRPDTPERPEIPEEPIAPRSSPTRNSPGNIPISDPEIEPDYDHESFHREYEEYEPPATPEHLIGYYPSLHADPNQGVDVLAQNNVSVEFRYNAEFEMYLNRFVDYALSCPPDANGCIVPSEDAIRNQIIEDWGPEEYTERLMDNCPRAIWIRANGPLRRQLSHICNNFYCCNLSHMVDEPYYIQLERVGCQGTLVDYRLRVEICRHTPRCTRITVYPKLPLSVGPNEPRKETPKERKRRLRAARIEQVKKQMRRRIKRMKTRKAKPKRRVPPSMYCPKPLRQLLRRGRL